MAQLGPTSKSAFAPLLRAIADIKMKRPLARLAGAVCWALHAFQPEQMSALLGRLRMPTPLAHLAPSAFGTETFSNLNDLLPGLRKMRGIHDPSLGERRVPYGRDHERHFPDRGRGFHLDWNVLKGALDLGNAQLMRGLGLGKLD